MRLQGRCEFLDRLRPRIECTTVSQKLTVSDLVFFVSISVDPETDTPTRPKEYASRCKARSGWMFLTGKKENVDWALYKLGRYVEQKDGHKTVFIIGNEATGLWKKARGLAKTDDLIEIVKSVADDKGNAAGVN